MLEAAAVVQAGTSQSTPSEQHALYFTTGEGQLNIMPHHAVSGQKHYLDHFGAHVLYRTILYYVILYHTISYYELGQPKIGQSSGLAMPRSILRIFDVRFLHDVDNA